MSKRVDETEEKALEPAETPMTRVSPDPDRPWLAFSGCLSEEDGEELSRLVNEMFPPWND